MTGFRTQYAANGDLIVNCYATALEIMGKVHISLGVCDMRCTSLKDLAPLACGWGGTAPASSKRCPICGRPLRRMTHHNWDGSIQLLGFTKEMAKKATARKAAEEAATAAAAADAAATAAAAADAAVAVAAVAAAAASAAAAEGEADDGADE